MKFTSYFLIISIASAIAGCQSMEHRPDNLDQYLQQFIGQSSTEIQKNLNFKSLGYKVSQDIQITENELGYTILRPLSIPMSGSNASVGSNAMGAPIIRYDMTSTPSYDINFNCKIVFKLKGGIAESVQYQGKAC